MSEELPQQETSTKGGSPNVHDSNLMVFHQINDNKASLGQGGPTITEHEQIHPEAVELEIESQYSSRQS
jgi:hypothetical protein